MCEQVFRSATHNRFEHSLGVMHLADRMLSIFAKQRKEDLEVRNSENGPGVRESLLNLWRRTVNLRRPERARNEARSAQLHTSNALPATDMLREF